MPIPAVQWKKQRAPRSVLAIRLQAMGDLVITLPYLQALRNRLPPATRLDLLTREEVEAIPKSLRLFNRVYSIGGGRHTKKQLLFTAALIPRLLLNRYEVVIDLQDNIISRLAMRSLFPRAWSLFDRLSEIPAGERTQMTIEAVGLGPCPPAAGFTLKEQEGSLLLLKAHGWNGHHPLVILNPAGAFETRNWPMDHYVRFAKGWLQRFPETRFLLLGTSFIASKAAYLEERLGGRCINLVNRTTPAQAFAILQQVQLLLSEDSGLMHMGWVSGIPTLALFGSTQSKKARPLGAHTAFLDSSDLPCGGCMLEHCRYGDTHCLSRYGPELVVEKCAALLARHQRSILAVIE
jgi:ADP-heptose:LPS heptosyltransferase